jgi:hypothetical protein
MNAIVKLIVTTGVLSLMFAAPVQAKGTAVQNILPVTEQTTLLTMREEEKLARDAYLTLHGMFGQSVFKNIAASEQRHMDALLKKINLFALTDPALPQTGRFTNPTFQALYTQFLQWLAQSKPTYIDALKVGATIEDLDINDLNAAIAATSSLALKTTYQNLLEGSKQHLRTFVGLLRSQGQDYDPQYIDRALFEAILGV